MVFIPPEFRHRGMSALECCLRSFVRAPSLLILGLLFLAFTALLAEPRRRGKARAEAASRTFLACFALLDSGDYTGLWEIVANQKLIKANQGENPKYIIHIPPWGTLRPYLENRAF